MNFNQLITELKRLNPNVEIKLGNPELDSAAYERIFCSVSADNLKLPEGFYFNDKNGITNKHNTESGTYISLHVEDIKLANPSFLLSEAPEPKYQELVSMDTVKERVKARKIKEVNGDPNYLRYIAAQGDAERQRELDERYIKLQTDKAKMINNAIMTGVFIVGYAAAVHFSGLNMDQFLEQELRALNSWGDLKEWAATITPAMWLTILGAASSIIGLIKNKTDLEMDKVRLDSAIAHDPDKIQDRIDRRIK